MATKIIDNVSDLGKLIEGIKGRARKLDSDIHQAALSAAAHFEKCGDTGFINRLYLALGKGARHEALTAWFLGFAGMQANTGESKDTQPFVKDANKQVDLVEGDKCPWYNMKQSKKPDEVVDLLKLAMALIKKAANPKEGQQIAHAEMLPELQALVEKFTPAEEVEKATEGQEG